MKTTRLLPAGTVSSPGAPHCAGNTCPGIIPGNCATTHAEVNALAKAQQLLESADVVDLYVTHSPCRECMVQIMNSHLSVRRLLFEVPYRNSDHLVTLRQPYRRRMAGLSYKRNTAVYEVTPAGYIVEYFSRRVVELP